MQGRLPEVASSQVPSCCYAFYIDAFDQNPFGFSGSQKKATVISIFNPTEIAHEFPSEDLRRLRLSYFLSIQRKYYQYNLYHGLRCSK